MRREDSTYESDDISGELDGKEELERWFRMEEEPDPSPSPTREEWRSEDPFGEIFWRSIPQAWLEDERIRPHHLELLMIFADAVDRPGGQFPSRRFTNFGTSKLSLDSFQRHDKIAKYSWQLHDWGVIELDPARKKRPAGDSFHRFRFPEEYRMALASRAPFAKMPQPVIVDRYLEPKLKRTYAALCLAYYVFGADPEDVFAGSSSVLAGWIGCKPRVVSDYTAELVRLGLVEKHGFDSRGNRYSFVNLHEHYVWSDDTRRWRPHDAASRMAARNQKYTSRRRSA